MALFYIKWHILNIIKMPYFFDLTTFLLHKLKSVHKFFEKLTLWNQFFSWNTSVWVWNNVSKGLEECEQCKPLIRVVCSGIPPLVSQKLQQAGVYYLVYNMSMKGASWGCGWWLPAPSDWQLWLWSGLSWRSGNTTIRSGVVWGSFQCIICPYIGGFLRLWMVAACS